MNKIIDDIGNFIFIENEPELSDIIFVVGGSHPESGEKAAELFHDGYAPLCFVGGGVSVKTGAFPGPKSKTDIYDKKYENEFDFYKDVLMKNGVDEKSIIGENKSSFTRENADFAKNACDKMQIKISRAILICKKFHARRAFMSFQSAFPNVTFFVVTVDAFDITKDNWYKTEYGVMRVLGELKRCGDQFDFNDISNFAK